LSALADRSFDCLEVGEGIKASGVPRSEMFITSKLWCTYHRRAEEGVDKTLADLGTDYLDLLLIHWPFPLNQNGNHPLFPRKEDGTRDHDDEWDIKDTWKQLEEIQRKGKFDPCSITHFNQTLYHGASH
jgi:glycerol 2-dehydrogenase (NADP+)